MHFPHNFRRVEHNIVKTHVLRTRRTAAQCDEREEKATGYRDHRGGLHCGGRMTAIRFSRNSFDRRVAFLFFCVGRMKISLTSDPWRFYDEKQYCVSRRSRARDFSGFRLLGDSLSCNIIIITNKFLILSWCDATGGFTRSSRGRLLLDDDDDDGRPVDYAARDYDEMPRWPGHRACVTIIS